MIRMKDSLVNEVFMKWFFKVLLMVSPVLAFAGNSPNVFIGKYDVKRCPLYSLYSEQDFSRAYVSIEVDSEKFVTLKINFYGNQGAKLEAFPFSEKSRQAPGTDVSIHGRVKETTQIIWNAPTDVTLSTRTQRPSIRLDQTKTTRLILQEGKLLIKTHDDQDKDSTCSLIKI